MYILNFFIIIDLKYEFFYLVSTNFPIFSIYSYYKYETEN